MAGDTLRYRGPREALAKLLPALKAHKPAILAALALSNPLPPLPPAAECAVAALLPLPKPRAPVNLDEALRTACEDVEGITPEGFRSLLSPEDVADIAAGDIHRKTLRAYAQSFAEGIRSGRVVVLTQEVLP